MLAISKRSFALAFVFVALLILAAAYYFVGVLNKGQSAQDDDLPAYVKTSLIDLESYSDHPIPPIPLQVDVDTDRAALGAKLFHDPILSVNNEVSCSTCHDLQKGGVVNEATTLGVTDERGVRNVPSVFNVRYNFSYFWDGRAETLAHQIDDVLQNPIEMGETWQNIERKLNSNTFYVADFERVYGTKATRDSIIDALMVYQNSLITPNSRFDQYVRGDKAALTETEVQGYELFQSMGCIACHQGVNIGGNLYQKLGIFKAYQPLNATKDQGRFEITQKEVDKYVFKVPSLRNIALTAPYLHDGSIATLDEVIRIMGEYQLGRQLKDAEVDRLEAFLQTLTGEYQGQ